jgi:hypothetical protein
MNYEVTDLFEVGEAGAVILDKGTVQIDEFSEPLRPDGENLDDV